MSRLFKAVDSPLGILTLVGDERGRLTELWIGDHLHPDGIAALQGELDEAHRQLDEYFSGARKTFELELAPVGSDFQRRVWAELQRIPYGKTLSYGELAAKLGGGTVARAVGRANATNPIAIVVPCHRVIGANGDLTGFAGGLAAKRWLLEFEGALSPSLF
jgi:methylated-DNA-[protein]-cysteine S-methyltransferase